MSMGQQASNVVVSMGQQASKMTTDKRTATRLCGDSPVGTTRNCHQLVVVAGDFWSMYSVSIGSDILLC